MSRLTYFLLVVLLSVGVAENNFFGLTKAKIEEAVTNFLFVNVSAQNIDYLVYQKGSNVPVPINTTVLNPAASFKFIVHGWARNATFPWIIGMAAALHKVGVFNIIAVDWSKYAAKNYIYSSSATRSIGNHIAELIQNLNINPDKVHLIGHSMGAHICGFTGQQIGKGKIGRISGLDPAGPLFELFPKNWKLSKDDAQFVDGVHVEIFWRGVIAPCGTADFYVNNGGPQPDCLKNDTAACSHEMAHTYYTLTIGNPKKYLGVKKGSADDTAYMGYWVQRTAKGSYSVTANATGIDPNTEF